MRLVRVPLDDSPESRHLRRVFKKSGRQTMDLHWPWGTQVYWIYKDGELVFGSDEAIRSGALVREAVGIL
jgi:hypothetical protein